MPWPWLPVSAASSRTRGARHEPAACPLPLAVPSPGLGFQAQIPSPRRLVPIKAGGLECGTNRLSVPPAPGLVAFPPLPDICSDMVRPSLCGDFWFTTHRLPAAPQDSPSCKLPICPFGSEGFGCLPQLLDQDAKIPQSSRISESALRAWLQNTGIHMALRVFFSALPSQMQGGGVGGVSYPAAASCASGGGHKKPGALILMLTAVCKLPQMLKLNSSNKHHKVVQNNGTGALRMGGDDN